MFGLLYSKEYHHSQIVSRSRSIFDLYLKQEKVGIAELDMLWELVSMEDQAKHDIYSLLIKSTC